VESAGTCCCSWIVGDGFRVVEIGSEVMEAAGSWMVGDGFRVVEIGSKVVEAAGSWMGHGSSVAEMGPPNGK